MRKSNRFVSLVCALIATVALLARSAHTDRKALLWEVTSGSATVYLLGTIHVGSERLYPLPAAVETADARATVIALEADPTDRSALMAVGSTMYQPPDSLDQHVPPALLDSLSAEVQGAMLQSTIDSLQSGRLGAEMTAMVDRWCRGDAAGLDELAQRDLEATGGNAARELRTRLYDQRNRDMTDKIVRLLAGKEVVLVGVGAGHMTGPTGITTLLAAKGFAVRRL